MSSLTSRALTASISRCCDPAGTSRQDVKFGYALLRSRLIGGDELLRIQPECAVREESVLPRTAPLNRSVTNSMLDLFDAVDLAVTLSMVGR